MKLIAIIFTALALTGCATKEYLAYAGVGFTWDGVGFTPPKPYSSWVLNSNTYYWKPPVARPKDDRFYMWDEPTLSWVEFTPPTKPV
jgi:hypothetical protein